MSLPTMFIAAEEGHAIDETHHWLLPETAEYIYGGIAFVVVMLLFWKLGVFKAIGKAWKDRTAKVQQQIDDSAAARATAETEASDIRRAAGDIAAERSRLLADADVQADQLLVDGRARIEVEVAELEARAGAGIASAAHRSGDELQGEISRLAAATAEQLVHGALDEATHQRLIEDFIAKVGATSGGNS
jgi:F-type H+-transporting ATPase subunit b